MSDPNDRTVRTSSNNPDDDRPKLSLVDSLIGTLFAEKYEIISLLGEGGMSKVYKARHKFMKRIVAVKLLHEDLTKDPLARARFQQEAEAASALSHQNVVTVHDFGFTPSGQAFFVMDCLEGKSLGEILEERVTIPIANALDIFSQGCDGLDHAHRKGIVHRDIKPSNLVIIKQEDGSDLVKLVDFGIAKMLIPPDGEKQNKLTMAGEIFGTPAYMSPEQCSGAELDARSDIYSFGCLMYEALSGDPPLLGDTFVITVTKHITERPKSLAETASHAKVPPHIDQVILKCLEKSPDDRYSSALELKQALFDAAYASGVEGLRVGAVREMKLSGVSGTGGSVSQGVSLAEQKVTRKWKLKLALALLLFAVIAGSVGTWLFLYPGPAGDSGTVFNKISWQLKMSSADDLIAKKNYSEAILSLESAKDLARSFGDDRRRLETTLTKLGEAYGADHKYSEQETINKQLVEIVSARVFEEYNTLMNLLAGWEKPASTASEKEERAQQAAAFAGRILDSADKLSIRSQDKQETLLKKSIAIFDSLEMKDWISSVRFRTKLAECYRAQQRFDELKTVLTEATGLCPEKPSTEDGWQAKVRAELLLGQYERNTAATEAEISKAGQRLERVLSWIKANLNTDTDLLKDSLNSLAALEKLYHKADHDKKALELETQARNLGH